VESFIDELAERAGMDPVEYRLALIDELQVDAPEWFRPEPEFAPDPERLKGVLRLAADRGNWGAAVPEGHGVGIACGVDHLTYSAGLVEVSVRDGDVRIERVVIAADCGPVLNPDMGRAQLEGGAIQGLSAALGERLTVRDGAIVQGNFDDYQVLRMRDAPATIETYFAETDNHPTGLGEPAVPPAAPALASAIYRATGERPRTLPVRGA
jgi:isoquinoline 1-oxidoreductase beta subunit